VYASPDVDLLPPTTEVRPAAMDTQTIELGASLVTIDTPAVTASATRLAKREFTIVNTGTGDLVLKKVSVLAPGDDTGNDDDADAAVDTRGFVVANRDALQLPRTIGKGEHLTLTLMVDYAFSDTDDVLTEDTKDGWKRRVSLPCAFHGVVVLRTNVGAFDKSHFAFSVRAKIDAVMAAAKIDAPKCPVAPKCKICETTASVSVSPSISNEKATKEECTLTAQPVEGGVVFSSTVVFMLVMVAFALVVAACAGFGGYRYAQREQRHPGSSEQSLAPLAGFI
jgi:hypothetical protein